MKPSLPEPLPDNPLPLVESWIAEALKEIRNATAMTLATVEPDGRPSARMVICRGFDAGRAGSSSTPTARARRAAPSPSSPGVVRVPLGRLRAAGARRGPGDARARRGLRRVLEHAPTGGARGRDGERPEPAHRRARRPARESERDGGTAPRARSRVRRAGAATACGPNVSSSGWASPRACTIAPGGRASCDATATASRATRGRSTRLQP